jgi:hypothetical protein
LERVGRRADGGAIVGSLGVRARFGDGRGKGDGKGICGDGRGKGDGVGICGDGRGKGVGTGICRDGRGKGVGTGICGDGRGKGDGKGGVMGKSRKWRRRDAEILLCGHTLVGFFDGLKEHIAALDTHEDAGGRAHRQSIEVVLGGSSGKFVGERLRKSPKSRIGRRLGDIGSVRLEIGMGEERGMVVKRGVGGEEMALLDKEVGGCIKQRRRDAQDSGSVIVGILGGRCGRSRSGKGGREAIRRKRRSREVFG